MGGRLKEIIEKVLKEKGHRIRKDIYFYSKRGN
jgi:hypothetical protein